MARIIEVKTRQRDPNTFTSYSGTDFGPGTNVRLLAASLKGARVLNLTKLGNEVHLEGVVGLTVVVNNGTEMRTEIYRGAPSSAGGVLIYQSQEGFFPTIDPVIDPPPPRSFVSSFTHVDIPNILGPVEYYLEIVRIENFQAFIRPPVTFRGIQIDPTT